MTRSGWMVPSFVLTRFLYMVLSVKLTRSTSMNCIRNNVNDAIVSGSLLNHGSLAILAHSGWVGSLFCFDSFQLHGSLEVCDSFAFCGSIVFL